MDRADPATRGLTLMAAMDELEPLSIVDTKQEAEAMYCWSASQYRSMISGVDLFGGLNAPLLDRAQCAQLKVRVRNWPLLSQLITLTMAGPFGIAAAAIGIATAFTAVWIASSTSNLAALSVENSQKISWLLLRETPATSEH
jgi:hypothetical protein